MGKLRINVLIYREIKLNDIILKKIIDSLGDLFKFIKLERDRVRILNGLFDYRYYDFMYKYENYVE